MLILLISDAISNIKLSIALGYQQYLPGCIDFLITSKTLKSTITAFESLLQLDIGFYKDIKYTSCFQETKACTYQTNKNIVNQHLNVDTATFLRQSTPKCNHFNTLINVLQNLHLKQILCLKPHNMRTSLNFCFSLQVPTGALQGTLSKTLISLC